jgi:hypothetical protein
LANTLKLKGTVTRRATSSIRSTEGRGEISSTSLFFSHMIETACIEIADLNEDETEDEEELDYKEV